MKRRGTTILVLVAGAVLICLAAVVYFVFIAKSDPVNGGSYLGSYESDSKLGVFTSAAVSTDARECAAVGRDILSQDGNAMDAAIATLVCMGLVIPESMGLGGGCFITYYDSQFKNSTVIDAREVAPDYASEDMFEGNKTLARLGPLAIAIPGELAGYWEAHSRFGRLPWKLLFEKTIQMSETGFLVGNHLASSIKQNEKIIINGQMRSIFVNDKNETYKEGEIMKRPDLAETLRIISKSSSRELYGGEIGRKLVEDVKSQGGKITLENLSAYQPRNYDALRMDLPRNLTIYGVKPPGSGAVLGFILNVIMRYEDMYPSAAQSLEGATRFYHRLSEVWKHAFSRRLLLGDNVFDDVTEVLANLTSDSYAEYIKSLVNDEATYEPEFYAGDVFMKEDHGTAHVSVIDKDGNAAAVGTTINAYFGSKILSTSTGILLNNQMDDFSSPNITNSFGVPPSPFNRIEPGKKPLSSMCPSVIVNSNTGQVVQVIGGSGGTQITTATSLVTLRSLLFGETIKQAIDAPRIHHQLFPNQISFEETFPQNILRGLEGKGHSTVVIKGRGSIIMGIDRSDNGTLFANSDFRKGGEVDGI